MPEKITGGRGRQPSLVRIEAQVAIRRAGGLDDEEMGIGVVVRNRKDYLDRILPAVLAIRRAGKHVVVRVDQEQVVVVCGGPQRVGPLQDVSERAVLRDPVLDHPAAEVVENADRYAVHGQRTPRGVIALPDPGRSVFLVAAVAARRDDDTAIGNRRVDRLRHDAVLKSRFPEKVDVVDDDVRPCLAERLDVGRQQRLSSARRRREIEICPRREVVDDLEHGRPLASLSLLPRQHRHPVRQVARNLPVGERIDAIREHPDPDARAVDAMDCAR